MRQHRCRLAVIVAAAALVVIGPTQRATAQICGYGALGLDIYSSTDEPIVDGNSVEAPTSETVSADDPWADPVLRWPDPLSESQLGTDDTYYWFTRADHRSLLPAPTTERPLRIWAGGDSTSGGPVYGFEQLIGADDRFVFTPEIIKSTGVVVDWYFDWLDHLASTVAVGPYDVIVLAIGGNDWQRFKGLDVEQGDPKWRERYRNRVVAMLEATVRPGRLVVWVGLPPLNPPVLRGLPSVVNPLAQEAVAAVDGTVYFDSTPVLSNDGKFTRRLTPGGPSIRSLDGVHYTCDGGKLLTVPILAEIIALTG